MGTQKREVRRSGQKKKGEWVRDKELLIRNRLEHTHTCTHIGVTSWAKNSVLKSQQQSAMEGVGGLAFSFFWQGKKWGNMERRARGYGQGLRLAKAPSVYNAKVRRRQVQLPEAEVTAGIN